MTAPAAPRVSWLVDTHLRQLDRAHLADPADIWTAVQKAFALERTGLYRSAYDALLATARVAPATDRPWLAQAFALFAQRRARTLAGRLQHATPADARLALGLVVEGGALDFVTRFALKKGAPSRVTGIAQELVRHLGGRLS